MRLITGIGGSAKRLGILPGTFNPPTRAHLGLAQAALNHVDRILMVLPGVLPHKSWDGASANERAEMLALATADQDRISAAVCEGGLAIEMIREAKVWFPDTQIYLVCGRDAAERIVSWDYGDEGAIARMLDEFRLLVASRNGSYSPPPHLAHAVETLETAGQWDEHSSTRCRNSILKQEDWEHLVPGSIHHLVRRIYGS